MVAKSVKIPEGVSVEAANGMLTVKGPHGTLERAFNTRIVDVKQENGEIKAVLKGRLTRKKQAVTKTVEAHLKNMFEGVSKKFEKKMQLVYSHFPITVEVKGKEIFIKNFLGEKTARKAKVIGEAKVEVKGQDIVVSGADVESVGQTAANIRKATRITKRDERVFQDGIYYAIE
ncbi:MAG TPA: 50S ribosomal protein L6 [Candidatus Norongarragalinales archaeon]|nr:50S ribosomal protein L6 [Candidatus Norongarragalinales archaeon]